MLFPARQRCKTCKKKLTTVVIDGLYDSYRCAKLPEPDRDVDKAPRHCKRMVNDTWGWKTKFKYEGEVPEKLRNDPATNIYRCDYCHYLHVGHSRVNTELPERLRRTVISFDVLASVITRVREQRNLTVPQVAKILKVPATRIKEIESGSPKANPVIMFQLMKFFRLTLEIIEQ